MLLLVSCSPLGPALSPWQLRSCLRSTAWSRSEEQSEWEGNELAPPRDEDPAAGEELSWLACLCLDRWFHGGEGMGLGI